MMGVCVVNGIGRPMEVVGGEGGGGGGLTAERGEGAVPCLPDIIRSLLEG